MARYPGVVVRWWEARVERPPDTSCCHYEGERRVIRGAAGVHGGAGRR